MLSLLFVDLLLLGVGERENLARVNNTNIIMYLRSKRVNVEILTTVSDSSICHHELLFLSSVIMNERFCHSMNLNSMKLQCISPCQPTSVVSMINPSLDCEVEITIISQNCIEKRYKQINHLFYPEHYNGMYEI